MVLPILQVRKLRVPEVATSPSQEEAEPVTGLAPEAAGTSDGFAFTTPSSLWGGHQEGLGSPEAGLLCVRCPVTSRCLCVFSSKSGPEDCSLGSRQGPMERTHQVRPILRDTCQVLTFLRTATPGLAAPVGVPGRGVHGDSEAWPCPGTHLRPSPAYNAEGVLPLGHELELAGRLQGSPALFPGGPAIARPAGLGVSCAPGPMRAS